MKSFNDAIRKLEDLVNYEHSLDQPYTAEHFDLDRYRRFLAELSSPEAKIPALHVAGTKGKGSVCLIAESILLAHGVSVGTYLSPHLYGYRERIRVDGKEISEEDFRKAFEEIEGPLEKAVESGNTPTHFEVLTALAFVAFRNAKVDYMILEVGLGGRLDATNICLSKVSVITSIGIEHSDILGDTMEKIAFEKAGIIRHDSTVWTGTSGEALRVIRRVAREKETRCLALGEEFQVSDILKANDDIGIRFKISFEKGKIRNYFLPLAGSHQAQNAALAYASALDVLKFCGYGEGENEKIKEGFLRVRVPGRVEIIRRNPPLILDTAHTPDSADALGKALQFHFPSKKHIIIIALLKDKDAKSILEELAPVAKRFIVTSTLHQRSMTLEEIAAAARLTGVPYVSEHDSQAALKRALGISGRKSGIVITGSFYLAGEVREQLAGLLEN